MAVSLPYFQADFVNFFVILGSRLLSGDFFLEMASDEMQIICLTCLGCLSSCVGSLLYLSHMMMLANTLSHTSLLGIVTGTLISTSFQLAKFHHPISAQAIFIGACVSAGLTAFLTYFFRTCLRIREDASLALVFSLLFAMGVAGVSLFWGQAHVGLDLIMGNIELVTFSDVILLMKVTVINILIFFLFKRGLIAFVFDREIMSCWFRFSSLFDILLLFQVAFVVMASLRIMGLFLPLAYLVGVPIWSRAVSSGVMDMWKKGTCLSLLLAIFSVAIVRSCLTSFGLALSSSGVSIVCLLFVHFFSWSSFRSF